jgi:hypothetical protein
MGPLAHLKRTAPADNQLQITIVDSVNWANLAMVDAVFMQRPFTDAHLKVASLCRANRKPLWVDYDDNLFKVPRDNPTYHTYNSERNQRNVATILAMADRVSVSTQKLARDYNDLRKKSGLPLCDVIPNALNELLFPVNNGFREQERHAMVMWRGSNTHDRDLMTVLPEIQAQAKAFKRHTFSFIGDPSWMFMEQLPNNCLSTAPVDPIEYFDVISKIKPQALICPLHDSEFNRAKSNIAWIEATYAGAAALVPNWEEWKLPGAVNYLDAKEFGTLLGKMISDPEFCQREAEKSWAYIKENLLLKQVNEKRRKLFDELTSSN